MWEDYGIYNPGPIQPVVKFRENLGIWTQNGWEYYRAEYIEPMPRSAPLVADVVALAGATGLAANATIQKQVVVALQLNDKELLQLRWEPLDNVEGVLWEQSGSGRFISRSAQARVDRGTSKYDPYLATTTFFVLGRDRDMNLEARNPMGVATPTARFAFWGYRYVLSALKPLDSRYAAAVQQGDLSAVKNQIGPVTWIPAEGRAS